jgi:hypothetical protein
MILIFRLYDLVNQGIKVLQIWSTNENQVEGIIGKGWGAEKSPCSRSGNSTQRSPGSNSAPVYEAHRHTV